mmetsp:Transcript_5373/g.10690  ORF Transcript_5373/g.10690 Transcript_5373/m.10690 type:complete len:93 (+) Transcript_5373:148-426(+)
MTFSFGLVLGSWLCVDASMCALVAVKETHSKCDDDEDAVPTAVGELVRVELLDYGFNLFSFLPHCCMIKPVSAFFLVSIMVYWILAKTLRKL